MFEQELLDQFPLHYFCCVGDANGLAACLLKGEHSPFTLDPLNDWSPAHWAIASNQVCRTHVITLTTSGHMFISVSFSIRLGCVCRTLPSHPTPFGLRSGQQRFCQFSHIQLCQVQLSGWLFCLSIINIQDASGDTPLHKAARKGHIDCIRLLVACGALVE